MAAAAPILLVLLAHLLLGILGHPLQAESRHLAGSAAMSPRSLPPSNEELSSSLVVNQLAILQMMQNVSDVSRAAAEASAQQAEQEDEAAAQAARLEEALRLHQEQVLEAVETGQQRRTQEILQAINTKIETAVQDTLTRVTEVHEETRREVDRILKEVRQPEEEAQSQEGVPANFDLVIHNDTQPSLCNGHKFLVGSMGSLAVVQSGTYANNLRCSWNITLPVTAPLSLDWEYFETESQTTCNFDWVTVDDLSRNGTSVYGGKMCGTPLPWVLGALDVVLPPTKNILVTFRSDGSGEFQGFRLNYRVVAP